jgi:secreted Zn-dependent insulinase-like peptidase
MKFQNNVRVLENPQKSLSDKKEYKLLRLVNDLTVLLIKQQERDDFDDESESDSEFRLHKKYKSNLAAVALCVGGGCFRDSHDHQGLSHLLEHMVRYKCPLPE